MPNAFEVAAAHVLNEEKGLVDNPKDPGGRTNFGVTQRLLDEVRKLSPELNLPLKVDFLTPPQARGIYLLHFWHSIRGDELPRGISLFLLDAAVNSSPNRAVRWLQLALGVTADGWIGAQTLAAARHAEARSLLAELSARRAHFYMLQDSIDDDFGLGWARRLFRTYNAALKEI